MSHPPSSPNPLSWARLERYLAGELPDVESRTVEAELMAHGDAWRTIDAYRASVQTLAPRPDLATVEVSLRALHQRLDRLHTEALAANAVTTGSLPEPERIIRTRLPQPTVRRLAIRALGLGGVVLGAVVGGIALWSERTVGTVTAPPHVYRTTNGRQATITLSDGSVVTLGNASTLAVPQNFGTRTRTLVVTGQAYFVVAQRAGAPFIVRTAGVATRVLGTSFMVRRYPTDSGTRVIVADGRVALHAQRDGADSAQNDAVLNARMAGTVRDSNHIAIQYNVDLANALSWTTGRLVFDSTPVREAIPEIERQFDVEIRVTDPKILSTTLTVSFDRETLSQVLDVLSLTFSAQHRRNGRVITFTPSRTSIRRAPAKLPARSIVIPEATYGR